jgi:hypothetical protein
MKRFFSFSGLVVIFVLNSSMAHAVITNYTFSATTTVIEGNAPAFFVLGASASGSFFYETNCSVDYNPADNIWQTDSRFDPVGLQFLYENETFTVGVAELFVGDNNSGEDDFSIGERTETSSTLNGDIFFQANLVLIDYSMTAFDAGEPPTNTMQLSNFDHIALHLYGRNADETDFMIDIPLTELTLVPESTTLLLLGLGGLVLRRKRS